MHAVGTVTVGHKVVWAPGVVTQDLANTTVVAGVPVGVAE